MKHYSTVVLIASFAGCNSTDTIEHGADANQCTPETDVEFCDRLTITCGPLQNNDNCGAPRLTNCGVCDFDAKCRNACNVPGGAQNCTAVDFNSCVNQCNRQTSDVSEACADCIVEHTALSETPACIVVDGAANVACDTVCNPTTDFFTATIGDVEMCALGWATVTASADGVGVSIIGECTGANMGVWFKPTPAPGNSAPCDRMQSNMTNFCFAQSDQYPVSGTVTVSETPNNFRIDGMCSCPNDRAEVKFSLPLTVN